MCRPDYFDIDYAINDWMNTKNKVIKSQALDQWESIYKVYTDVLGWTVKLMSPEKNLPDLVFTANGGLTIDGKVALPTFRHPVRQPETKFDEQWFKGAGYTDLFKPVNDFEGEGDALLWNDIIFAGYPWRSDKQGHAEIANFFGKKVVSLQLIDSRFYHLDTALTIIDSQTVALWPGAFADKSLQAIKGLVPKVIEASYEDALAYGLNAMSDGKNIVLSNRAENLISIYSQSGYKTIPLSITQFQKSGGGVKCLSLELRN
jgi:N-dimethylarginine dimethylaminohydrolase